MEKAGDVEAKTNLQPPFYIREIDSRFPKDHHLSAKKDKEDTYWEPHDETSKDKDKAKSQTSSSTNQPQTQAPKKDKCGHRRGHGSHPATGVNATKIAKKDKDKAPKNLSHVKYYICHRKGHYTNKCLEKSKNQWRSWQPLRQ